MHTSTRYKIQKGIQLLRTHTFDWDGAAGLPIRDDVLHMASAIFCNQALLSTMRLESCVEPDITLNPNGTVNMVFDTASDDGGKQLLLMFRCGGVITYVKFLEDVDTSIEGTVRVKWPATNVVDFRELTDLINWIAEE